jgi:hypothetical protein
MANLPNMSEDVASRIAKISGMVVDRNGKGGSGTCVRLEDGKVGLLTAKHVVFECIRNTGEIAIAVPAGGVKFHRPLLIRMDSSHQGDAALLVSDQLASLPAIPFEEWTTNHPDVGPNVIVTAVGFPAVSKKVEGRRIDFKLSFLEDIILSVDGNSIISGINEKAENMPKHLYGMSGGGLFAITGEFLGIVVAERRNVTPTRGELDVLLPRAYQELYKPFSIPPDSPGPGFHGEDFTVVIQIHDNFGKLIATIGSNAQTYWSSTNPEHKFGRVGRLLTLEIIIPGIDIHYPINIESMFYNWADDSHETRRKAAQEEFKYLLMRMGWLFSDEGEGSKTVLKIRPMI